MTTTPYSFVLSEFGINTGVINGTQAQSNATLRTVNVSFVANVTGMFNFNCGLPPTIPGQCEPDMSTQMDISLC